MLKAVSIVSYGGHGSNISNSQARMSPLGSDVLANLGEQTFREARWMRVIGIYRNHNDQISRSVKSSTTRLQN